MPAPARSGDGDGPRARGFGDDPQPTGTLAIVCEPSPIHADALLAQAAWLHRLARAMLRNDDLAHDLAQETLVVALGKSGADVGNLRAWLQVIAKRLAMRRARAEARRRGCSRVHGAN